jgi:uncharacterized repeat protein (TIGR01451 family)
MKSLFIRIMKRTLTIFLFSVICTLAYGQGSVSSVWPNSGMPGQTVTVTLIGQNVNFNQTTLVYLDWNEAFQINTTSYMVYSDSVMTTDFTIPGNAPYQQFNFMPTWLSSGLFTVSASNPNTSFVSGIIYKDLNSNCINDASDPKYAGAAVTLNPGGYTVASDTTGNYSAWVPPGNYTATVSHIPGQVVTCPVSQSWAVNIPLPGNQANGTDFGLEPISYQDVQVSYSSLPLRPGIPRGGIIFAANYGPLPFVGDLTFVHDTMVNPGVANFSILPSYYSGDTAIWNLNMASDSTFICTTNFSGNLNAQIGDTARFTLYADTTVADSIPGNNRWNSEILFVNSYDPNDKAVSLVNGANAEGNINPDQEVLIYKVRFQNTGTDTAFNIHVLDTLDANLDPTTVRVMTSSHPYTLTTSAAGEMDFAYANIMLPDSFVDEPASNGFVIFQVDRVLAVPDGTDISNSASIYFDFNPPVLTNTVTTTICSPVNPDYSYTSNTTSVTFSNQSTGFVTSQQWDFGDGSFSSAYSQNHVYSAAGVYIVCLTTNSVCDTVTYCDTVVVTCPAPSAGFSSSTSFYQATFINQSASQSGTTYAWDFGDGNSSTLVNPTHAYTAPGNYLACLTVNDHCGSVTHCDTVVVTCPAPAAAFSSIVNLLQADFSNQSTGQSGATYSWDFGDGNSGTQFNPIHTYASPGNYLACLTVNDVCGSVTYCDTIVITCPAPAAAFTSSSNLFQASFTNQSTAQSGATYAWDFGDGNSSTMQSPSHTYLASGNYLVCLAVNDVCGSVTHCDTVIVTCPVPTSSFMYIQNQLQVSFGTITNGTGTITYAWDFGDGNTSTISNAVHTYSVAGTYPVCLITTDDCGSVTYCDTITVVCAPPQAALNYTVNGLQVQFNDNSVGAIVSYLWDFGDGNTSSAASPMHTYAGSGTYTACLQVTNDCGSIDTSCVTLSGLVGMEKPGPFRTISLYPNPNDGHFQLETELVAPGHLKLRIFNLLGKQITEMDQGSVQGTFQKQIDLGDLPTGNYLLQFDLDGRTVNRIFTIRD